MIRQIIWHFFQYSLFCIPVSNLRILTRIFLAYKIGRKIKHTVLARENKVLIENIKLKNIHVQLKQKQQKNNRETVTRIRNILHIQVYVKLVRLALRSKDL